MMERAELLACPMTLREALRDSECPRPCNGEPDDLTVGACVDKGQCGCQNGVALAAAPPQPTPGEQAGEGDDWHDDPTSDERWSAGLDFAMTQLCAALGVDPDEVTWDAATEEVEGDVRAVLGNILRAKLGDDWSPTTPQPTPGFAEGFEACREAAVAYHRQNAADCRAIAAVNQDNNLGPDSETHAIDHDIAADDIASLRSPAAPDGLEAIDREAYWKAAYERMASRNHELSREIEGKKS